jgi:DNA repair exonuclease SbcCD ATPase subunit
MMHSRSTFLRPLCRVVAFLAAAACGAAAASAQSLGDLAKQEEARRKAIKSSGKVYTNDNVRNDPASRPAPASAAGTAAAGSAPGAAATPPSPSGVPPSAAAGDKGKQTVDAPPAADPKQNEAGWRKRVQAERDALARAQTFAEALQSRINALTNDFSSRDDPAQRAVIATERQKALAELDRVKLEIQQHTKAISGIQEEARKSGVPPGWVR